MSIQSTNSTKTMLIQCCPNLLYPLITNSTKKRGPKINPPPRPSKPPTMPAAMPQEQYRINWCTLQRVC